MQRSKVWLALLLAAAAFVLTVSSATGDPGSFINKFNNGGVAPPSGTYDFRDVQLGTGLTECPQAGSPSDQSPKPLDRRNQDRVEQISKGGDDVRANQPEFSCFPQNETSVDINPVDTRNVMTSQNDYRLGFGSSGINASTDNGNHFYTLIAPFPSLPSGDNLDGGGDPVSVFDRAGIAYYADINFNRTDDTNGIWVRRSTNGAFTWSRPCVAIDSTPADPTDDQARCGGTGDPRQPGDGTVVFDQDNDLLANGSVPFNDKEYMTAGPRPAGVTPVSFTPIQDQPFPTPAALVGVDRLYVTWTRFTATDATIQFSFSDDQGRSWSPPKAISGSAPFCTFGAGNACDFNQFSVPTVNPATGLLGITFENFNTPDENQYLFVRSRDGGTTFEGPFFITPVFDVNYPRSGVGRTRPDCRPRGQQNGRAVLTNTCFRVNSGGNVVADRRGGDFADDFYMVFSDNRNGSPASSNSDVFLFRSVDGGTTWIGPTRVNDDRSQLTGSRDSSTNRGNFGNDQWFPWVDISSKGDLNVVFHDRRNDDDSVASEWPTSRQRPGNYLAELWGGQCSISSTGTVTQSTTVLPRDVTECTAPEAGIVVQPTGPVDPGSGAQPGQSQSAFPVRNFTISDVPFNLDYAFRAGIFMGDYNNVAIADGDNTAYAFWTDSRNGRSSGGSTGSPPQAGRNPACEQSDVFLDSYSANSGGTAKKEHPQSDLFLVTPCPTDIQDKGAGKNP
ncbi:MAG TPA: sialidase family protein [Plantibacter sp.]|uniref:sialidase family protein n=1 Tax=Plantibacter sp. TaxID=1871045 RepID=UPI002C2ABB25|nr:sialidase family protein [Plantibacter sp.]